MTERRLSIRIECELPSSMRNLDQGYPQRLSPVLVKNISRGGVCLRIDEFVSIQSRLYFCISLPNNRTIEACISPAWIVELPHLGKYEMGARFVEMSPEQEDAIQEFQYQILLKKIPSRANLKPDLAA